MLTLDPVQLESPGGLGGRFVARDDPNVWSDLLTADYTTGTSNTDVFQSDGPAAPTGLSIVSFPTSIQFTVTLPTYMAAGSWVELWEYTASTPFGSATKIAESRSTVLYVSKRDITSRYYWVRVRAQNGALSGTFPASTGQSGAADYVQSGDVAVGAVCDVYSSSSATPTTYTTDGNSRASLSFTASQSGSVTFIATFDASIASGSGSGQVILDVHVGGNHLQDTSTFDTTTKRYALSVTTTMTAGQSVTADLLAYGATVNVTISNSVLKSEAIKR